MKKYQPLVLQKLDIRIPSIHVRRLALHRHLPETTNVEFHEHQFAQSLLYLSGQGTQEIGGHSYPVETGTAVFLPPGIRHSFRRAANRRPLCLVLDFDWRGAKSKLPQVTALPTAGLHEIRQQLSRISQCQRLPDSGPVIRISGLILGLLDLLLVGWVIPQARRAEFQSPVARKIRGLLDAPGAASVSVRMLAAQAGYQHDYLNRLLKQHDGLTVGQMRARRLLTRAQDLLMKSDSVTEVALHLGFSDPNYFARWFRKNVGMTPSQWRTRTVHP